ncbi:MAG TPA: hypothetical protein VJN93_16720 [Candidatus Acidoferrum sp.]|nr:hypothetical protein [Candidatus Acidoferrum sp.]
MRCPKCQFDHELQTTECLKCGIVFSRYRGATEGETKAGAAAAPTVGAPAQGDAADGVVAVERKDAVRELKLRIFAVPVALLAARLVAGTGLRLAAAMLAMVLHESGHAITAWLTGRWAVPMLWVTPHGQERSWAIVVLVTGAIGFGGYVAWRLERWGWVAAAVAALLLQVMALSSPAGATIVFFGDGGALVLATLLMAMFYVPRESAVARSWGLRWGLLAIGALSFVHVFLIWTGPIENLPFGEIEGVNLSDPSLLTEMYGWTALQMVDRYVRLGTICLGALGAVYVWGLVSAYVKVRRSSAENAGALANG